MTWFAVHVNVVYNYVMEEQKPYRMTLRIPYELYIKLEAKAKQEKRTLTSQIVYLLEKSLK